MLGQQRAGTAWTSFCVDTLVITPSATGPNDQRMIAVIARARTTRAGGTSSRRRPPEPEHVDEREEPRHRREHEGQRGAVREVGVDEVVL